MSEAQTALNYLSPDCGRAEWVRIGMALKAAGGTFEQFDSWSAGAPSKYSATDCRSAWNSFHDGGGVTAATLFGMAKAAGYVPEPQQSKPPRPPRPQSTRERLNPVSAPMAAQPPAHIAATLRPAPTAADESKSVLAAVYEYRDRTGQLRALVLRYDPKDFRPKYALIVNPDPDGFDDPQQWAQKKPDGFEMPAYHEDRIAAAAPGEIVYLTEGEKDADNLAKLGYLTSCHKATGGVVRSWRGLLARRSVTIIGDADSDGQKYAGEAAALLSRPNEAGRVNVVFPPEGKDISDWIAAQGNIEPGELRRRFEVWAIPADMKPAEILTLADLKARIDAEGEVDPNELIKDRFLCKGGAGILAAETGCGKSSFIMQAILNWAIGRPAFGLEPVRPLRILLIQAENDPRDLAEEISGVCHGMATKELLAAPQISAALAGVKVISCADRCGDGFIEMLLSCLEQEKDHLDLVIIDPLFAFCGCDISKQDEISRFLRNQITPAIQRYGVGLVIVHHMIKPSKTIAVNQSFNQSYNYHGSSEVINWARFALILERFKDASGGFFFRLIAPKRGRRLPWAEKYLQWANDAIYWEELQQAPAMAEAPEVTPETKEHDKLQRLREDAERAADILQPGQAMSKADFRRSIIGQGICASKERVESILAVCIEQGFVNERSPRDGEGGRGISKMIEKPSFQEQAELALTNPSPTGASNWGE